MLQKTRKVLKIIEELMHGATENAETENLSAAMKLNAARLRLDHQLAPALSRLAGQILVPWF